VLPTVALGQSLAAIEALRAENYEYKTGTDVEGRLITNRPELDEDYDPDEWMPAAKYDPSQLQSAKLNPDLSAWDKKLWTVQKDKPLRPGRQMMVRKPKELIVPKSIGLPQQRRLTTAFETKEPPLLPIFERLNALYSEFKAVVTKSRVTQMVYFHPNAPQMTLMQNMRRYIQEEQPESMPAFIQWQEIKVRLGVILLAIGAFELQSESHPAPDKQIAMTSKLKESWEKLTHDQQSFLECKEVTASVVVGEQPADDGRFYADCTRIEVKAVELPGMVFERNLDGSVKLLTAEEYYLKDCCETEEGWYVQFMKQNPKATPLAAKKHLLNLRCRYIPPEKTLVFKIPGLEEYERQQQKKQQAVTEAPFQDPMAPASAPPSPKSESQHASE
jgi:hypothetical protein